MAQTTVVIPSPCPKSWAAMTPTGDGRYCAACQTEVIDFTRLSTEEVLAYLAGRPGQRICGIIMQSPEAIESFGTTMPVQYVNDASNSGPSFNREKKGRSQTRPAWRNPITINGLVVTNKYLSRETRPVGKAQVMLVNTKGWRERYGVFADEAGRFTITFLPDAQQLKNGWVDLAVSSSDMNIRSKRVRINLRPLPCLVPITVHLPLEDHLRMGEISALYGDWALLPPPLSRRKRPKA